MKTKAKTFHIIVWSMLTLAGFNLLAAKEPLYDGLGSYSRKVTTDSAEAQRYFDQGLGFLRTLILSPFHRPQRSSRGRNLSLLKRMPGTRRRLSGR